MKQVTRINENVYTIFSEPGDATRYEYLIYRDGPDWFTCAPTRSTFNFPQRMNFWNIRKLTPEGTPESTTRENPELDQIELTLISNRYNCNPCTVLEVARTILEIKEGRYEES